VRGGEVVQDESATRELSLDSEAQNISPFKYYSTVPPFESFRVTIFITPRLHGLYQGPLASNASPKYLTFPNSGILTRFEGGITQGPTDTYSGGGIG
jgi:hypothetical protein